jgi:hypothetical protein
VGVQNEGLRSDACLGADTDGYYRVTVASADRIEKCYVQNSAGPRQAIVATCFMMNKVKN